MTDQQLKDYKPENETQLQCKCVLIISQEFPQLRGKVWHTKNEIFIRRIAIEENGKWRVETDAELEQRRRVEGGRNKAEGLVAGIPDILIRWRGLLFGIELKIDGGKLSDSQKELHYTWEKDGGVPVVTFFDLYSVISYIRDIVEYTPPNQCTELLNKLIKWFSGKLMSI